MGRQKGWPQTGCAALRPTFERLRGKRWASLHSTQSIVLPSTWLLVGGAQVNLTANILTRRVFMKKKSALKWTALVIVGLIIRAWWPVNWKEEVQLQSGEVISVRNVNWIDQAGPWGTSDGEVMEWILKVDGDSVKEAPPIWIGPYAPLLIDRYPNGQWFIVATSYMCERMWALGKPYQPYTQYVVVKDEWHQVRLDNNLVGRLTNLGPGIRSDRMNDLSLQEKRVDRIKREHRIYIKYLKIATLEEMRGQATACQ